VIPDATVFIVDDDPAVREGLTALLTAKKYRVESFASAEEFLAAAAPDRVGCLIADVRMSGMSGLDLQRELGRRGSPLPTVIITGHGDVPLAVAALKAGAVDFLEKPFDSDAILASIEQALRRIGRKRDSGFDRAEVAARAASLSSREREVMDLVVAGHPNKVAAHRLGIAVRTVEIHRARVMEKLGARNLSELVRMAILLESEA
jgi:two-component system response regulator DctR/two-component system response regulator FixJ